MSLKLDITTFEDACDYTVDMIGADFEKAVQIAEKILSDTDDYMNGPAAAKTAIRLAGYRAKIGLAAQYWKLKSSNTKKHEDRLVKDALMVMYASLEEVINTLKIVARHDHELARG